MGIFTTISSSFFFILTLLLSTSSVSFTTAVTILDTASSIWYPTNTSALYVYLRSPEFVLPVPVNQLTNLTLFITAHPSPNVAGQGCEQSKLLGAYKLYVNGVFTTAGPGHNNIVTHQAVNTVLPDYLYPLVRDPPATNVLGIASYFNHQWKTTVDPIFPGVQAILQATVASTGTVINVTWTSDQWLSYDATNYYNPDGDNGNGAWYHLPNEDLNANNRPLGWEYPGYTPTPNLWKTPILQPSFSVPFYLENAPPPATLWRKPCTITPLPSSTATCAVADESMNIVLNCNSQPGTNSSIIDNILFASYGTPSGVCLGTDSSNNFTINGTCNSPNTEKVISQLCLGKSSCTIAVSNALFGGDPCHLTPKHLAVAVGCSKNGSGTTTYSYLVDYGQEFMGGVNISFIGSIPPNSTVLIQLGEELLPNGQVKVPTRADENYTSRWTLVPVSSSNDNNYNNEENYNSTASPNANIGLVQHEFIQFRFAQIIGSPVPLTMNNIQAWVVQHPFLGTGKNPYEFECSTSTPNVQTYGRSSVTPSNPQTLYGYFASSDPYLDAVFNMTAYSAISSSLDINVDSQTRQRDLCHIDALITGTEQYYVFPPGDYGIQKRTFINAYGNDSAIWGSWTEFKQSGALMAYSDALYTGDVSIGQMVWSDDDNSITSDLTSSLNSIQFYAGLRYFNGSGNGLLYYPNDCGGSWACDPLVDWPTNTRDNYTITGNTMDAIRNGLGAVTIRSLAHLANWIGKNTAAQRYTKMADSISTSILNLLLRYNGTKEAYFVDGVNEDHAAIHSTVYAVASGILDYSSDPTSLATLLTAYMVRRDTGTSSAMTARWYVDALYRLGTYVDAAADFAYQLMSRTTYPSWGNMIFEWNATCSLEAWAPGDKWNTDFCHPWTAAPAFLIPSLLAGIQPINLGWSRILVSPQPSTLSTFQVIVPTSLGGSISNPVTVNMTFDQYSTNQTVGINLVVPTGTTAQVCLPPLHTAYRSTMNRQTKQSSPIMYGATDTLQINGQTVSSSFTGRMLCTVTDINPGNYNIQRLTTAVTV